MAATSYLQCLIKRISYYEEAELLYHRSLEIRKQQLGADHPYTAQSLNNLAALYELMGRYAEAEPLLWRSLEIREQHLGTDHPSTAISLGNLGQLYVAMEQYKEAEELLLQALQIFQTVLGSEHIYVEEVMRRINNLVAGCRGQQSHLRTLQPSDYAADFAIHSGGLRGWKIEVRSQTQSKMFRYQQSGIVLRIG